MWKGFLVGVAGLFHDPDIRKICSPKFFELRLELFFVFKPYKQA